MLKTLIFLIFSFSLSSFAQSQCPNLSGEYETAKIVQTGCQSLQLTQYRPEGDLTDNIILDNVYRKLPSMPQFDTASTFNEFQIIFNSKDKLGKHVRIFQFSLTAQGDFLSQRIVLDGNGHILSADGFVDSRVKN